MPNPMILFPGGLKKALTLSYDDGVEQDIRLIDIMNRSGLKGTFNLNSGEYAPEGTVYPAGRVHRRMTEAEVTALYRDCGQEVATHGLTHPFLDKMSVEEIKKEVQACTDKIIEITGEAPKFFRPPFIAVSQAMYDNIDMTFICGMGCEDWVPTVTAEQRAERVLANAADGQIVLLHDMQWNQATVEALKTIIPELKKRGYDFVTVPRLFERKNVTPRRGWLYTNVLQETSDNRL